MKYKFKFFYSRGGGVKSPIGLFTFARLVHKIFYSPTDRVRRQYTQYLKSLVLSRIQAIKIKIRPDPDLDSVLQYLWNLSL